MKDKIVKVLLYEIKGFFENTLDFLVKVNDSFNYNNLNLGKRVLVKVGYIYTYGIIIDIIDKDDSYNFEYDIKPIIKVIDEKIYFSKNFLSLLLYFNKNLDYNNTYTKLSIDVIYKYFKEDVKFLYRLNPNFKEQILNNHNELLKYLDFDKDKKLTLKYLDENKEYLKKLEKENLIFKTATVKDSLNFDISFEKYGKKDLINIENIETNNLNFDKLIINNINKNQDISFYIDLINNYKKNNQKILFLFNNNLEINNFYESILKDVEFVKNDIIFFNSYNLKTKKSFKEAFLGLLKDEFKIILAFSNLLFYDIKNLGLIYVFNYNENYQDTIVKNEINFFHFLKIKKSLLNLDIMFETFLPSIELYSKFLSKDIIKLYDSLNYSNNLKIIDMFETITQNDFEIIPKDIIEKIIKDNKNNKKTLVLFDQLNYSKKVSCSNCKYVYKCDNCNVNLSFNKQKNILFCRYCSKTLYFEKKCIICQKDNLIYSNLGIERVHEELKKLFKNFKIKLYNYDNSKLIDINKELNFSNYDLFLIDFKVLNLTKLNNLENIIFLNIDNFFDKYDYKNNQNTFLNIVKSISISQDKTNIYILNLYKNTYLDSIVKKDFDLFLLYEQNIRKELNLPPFINGYTIFISTNTLLKGYQNIFKIFKVLKEKYNLVQRPKETLDFILNKTSFTFKILIKSEKDIYKDLKKYLNSLKENEKEFLYNIRLIGDYKI